MGFSSELHLYPTSCGSELRAGLMVPNGTILMSKRNRLWNDFSLTTFYKQFSDGMVLRDTLPTVNPLVKDLQ